MVRNLAGTFKLVHSKRKIMPGNQTYVADSCPLTGSFHVTEGLNKDQAEQWNTESNYAFCWDKCDIANCPTYKVEKGAQ